VKNSKKRRAALGVGEKSGAGTLAGAGEGTRSWVMFWVPEAYANSV
jgi:hypothetical protein